MNADMLASCHVDEVHLVQAYESADLISLCCFRSCTDLICCILFLAVIAGYMVMGVLGRDVFIIV